MLEKYQDSLFNYRPMPRDFQHDMLRKGELEDLKYENLAQAKEAYLKAWDDFEAFFKENPEAKTPHISFGMLDKDHWDLVNRKHFDHHFRQFGLIK